MQWISGLAVRNKNFSLESICLTVIEKIKDELGDKNVDIAFCFVSSEFASFCNEIKDIILANLSPRNLIGCTAGGIIAEGIELENEQALAIMVANLPGVKVKGLHLEDSQLPDLDASPESWEELLGVQPKIQPQFILLPDPFSFRTDLLIQGLDYAFPKSIKIGGLASGASQPGKNVLFLNDKVYTSGAVGLALSGNIEVESIVAQGCRPVGKRFRVTKCQKNLLMELDGKPALQALYDLIESMSAEDRQLAKYALFLGVAMDEFKDEFKHGDFLVRNILGLEPNSGALLVGEILRNERTVQFHLRDAQSSSSDLRNMFQSNLNISSSTPKGAILFSCLGRGESLYGVANHDSDCFQQYYGSVPLTGFFCNGEIGPVGDTTFLHGYTSSFALFRPKS